MPGSAIDQHEGDSEEGSGGLFGSWDALGEVLMRAMLQMREEWRGSWWRDRGCL